MILSEKEPAKYPLIVKKNISRFGKYALAAVFIIYIGLSLISFCVADEQKLIDRFEDDAFYYFKVAKNVSDGQGLTFDGTTITNGFHPLWMLVILPIFIANENPILCLRIIGVLSVLLAGLTAYLGFRRLSKYPFIISVIPGVLFFVSVASISNTGMETAILLPLLLTALIMLETDVARGEKIILVSIFLALAILARLDVVILVFIVGLLFIGKSRRNLWIAVIPGLVLGIYLSVNLLLTGHLIPTSGAAKSLNAPGYLYNVKFLNQLVSANNPVDGNLWIVFAMAFLISTGLVVFFLFDALMARSLKNLAQNKILLAVAGFFISYTVYYLLRSSWVLWRWYSYPLVLFSIFIVPFLFERIFARFEPYPSISLRLKVLFGGVSLFLIFFATSISLKDGLWVKTAQPSFKYSNYLAALILDDRLAAPKTLAMGDRAGSFAYFFDGNVLQLEGLLGDYKLLDAIQRDQLSEYMNEFGVDYVVSYSKPPFDYTRWELHTPLPELTSGPTASIPLCKENEYTSIDTQFGGLYVWIWPGCDG